MATLTTNIVAAVIFAVLGIVTLVVSFVVIDRITPFNLWKEIVEDQNSALAILMGLIALGISVIIAAAIH